MNFFKKLKSGLSKTRSTLLENVGAEPSRPVDEEFYEMVEDGLIAADLGVDIAEEVLEKLRAEVERENITLAKDAWKAMKLIISDHLTVWKLPDEFPPKPWVTLVVGVNGVGKTTTIGKLAHESRAMGKKVLMGAADTFRAGAIDQLRIWAERTDSAFVSQQEHADPASVAFDAMQAAKARNIDIVYLDTAGRLHNKTNLMAEIEKIVRIIKRNTPHAPNEILLVIDATTGQNGLKQAEIFNQFLGLTGLVFTKLDGTAKGGIALAVTKKLQVPIKKIGVGEGLDDLQDFNPVEYVDAMFGDLSE